MADDPGSPKHAPARINDHNRHQARALANSLLARRMFHVKKSHS
jgi:hypothetical protein